MRVDGARVDGVETSKMERPKRYTNQTREHGGWKENTKWFTGEVRWRNVLSDSGPGWVASVVTIGPARASENVALHFRR